MREESEDVGTSLGFLRRCYGVLEVVGYGVDCESTGLLEEFGGRGWDWDLVLEMRFEPTVMIVTVK